MATSVCSSWRPCYKFWPSMALEISYLFGLLRCWYFSSAPLIHHLLSGILWRTLSIHHLLSIILQGVLHGISLFRTFIKFLWLCGSSSFIQVCNSSSLLQTSLFNSVNYQVSIDCMSPIMPSNPMISIWCAHVNTNDKRSGQKVPVSSSLPSPHIFFFLIPTTKLGSQEGSWVPFPEWIRDGISSNDQLYRYQL